MLEAVIVSSGWHKLASKAFSSCSERATLGRSDRSDWDSLPWTIWKCFSNKSACLRNKTNFQQLRASILSSQPGNHSPVLAAFSHPHAVSLVHLLSPCKSLTVFIIPLKRAWLTTQVYTLSSACCMNNNSLFVAPIKSNKVGMNNDADCC